LGEVGTFIRGRRFTKADRVDEGGLPSIHYGEIYTYYGIATSDARSYVRADLAPVLRFAQARDVIIAAVGETVEDVGKAVAWLGQEPVAVHDDCFIFRSPLDPKFVAYFMQSAVFNKPKEQHVARAKVKRLSSAGLARIGIPVPPPELQREIVEILDQLTTLDGDLAAELEAELKAREAQYAHYREALFAFPQDTGVQRFPMGSLGQFIRGRRFTKKDYVDVGGVPVIHYGEIYTHYGTAADSVLSYVRADMASSLRCASPGDVILTDVGETVDDVGKAVAWLGSSDVAIHDHCYAFRHSLNPTFVSYYMQTNRFRAEKAKHVARTKVKTLLMSGLAKVCIPVPPATEQERIVNILDSFDELVRESADSLNAEMVARRRQYEYYREKLLTFEEALS
jgi:type I restriction enzyme, S subunit